jgi:hypothetical protein
MIDWFFTVLRPPQEFFIYMETSPLPVKDCKTQAYAQRSGRDLYRVTPAETRDLGFPVSSGGPPHLVASYETQGDVDDLF